MAESRVSPGDPALERELKRTVRGEVRFDALTRGLYSTDASHYQIEPLGVVFPRSIADVEATLAIARGRGVPILPRGGGTSQCGQAIGRAIVIDTNRHLTGISPPEGADSSAPLGDGLGGIPTHVEVEPGVVLDRLNAFLRPHGVWFPVDPSTGSRATLGGMAGNNSAGARSIRYGMMADNVAALDVVLADGRSLRVGEGGSERAVMPSELEALRSLYAREAGEIARRAPRTMRNVAGYALGGLHPDRESLARLLVGSEGTLAFFSRLRLTVSRLPRSRALGVARFPTLLDALDAVQHLVALEPSAVELVDENVLRLAADNPDFRATMATFVRGQPGALLLVEFESAEATADLASRLRTLDELLGDLGFPDALECATTPEQQAAIWNVRKAGLNIVMSMAGPRKPISFIEDCAVPLEHLADYARRVDEIFRRHGTEGTWYAHASVGCLHVRPALNLKDPDDVALVRRIAEETHEVVRELGGTHSGEHGDGILRSEFLRVMLGERLASAFAEVKRTFDPTGMMNPGKIVDPPPMDDRSLFRYGPSYAERPLPVVLDWTASGGILGAVERCNNNGACRKHMGGVMCPSFRVTDDERHSTRGRANALRLALTGQLGASALDSPEMNEAMSLCISCKGCRRECPAGVDMARLKLEWQHHRNGIEGVRLRDRALAALPRLAPRAGRLARVLAPLGRGPLLRLAGLAPDRRLPRWHARPWHDDELRPRGTADVALFVDTFTRWFEPDTARAAVELLTANARNAVAVTAPAGERPLCCGRTYLSAGMLDEARAEGARLLGVLTPLARAGVPIVGLEPSCLYTLRDEIPALLPGENSTAVARQARLLEEHLDEEWEAGRLLPLGRLDPTSPDAASSDPASLGAASPDPASPGAASPGAASPDPASPRGGQEEARILVHGHCHQKAFDGFDAALAMLRRIPGAEVEPIESGCCGMAGSFGYHAEHYDASMAMGELALLPAVRRAEATTRIVATGTSCRTQIADGAGRGAVHAASVLVESLRGSRER